MKKAVSILSAVLLLFCVSLTAFGQTTGTAVYQVKLDRLEAGEEAVCSITCTKTSHPLYAVQVVIPYDADQVELGTPSFGGKYAQTWQYNDTGEQLIALFSSGDLQDTAVSAGEEILRFTVSAKEDLDDSFFDGWKIDSGSYYQGVVEMESSLQFPEFASSQQEGGSNGTVSDGENRNGVGESPEADGGESTSSPLESDDSSQAANASGTDSTGGDSAGAQAPAGSSTSQGASQTGEASGEPAESNTDSPEQQAGNNTALLICICAALILALAGGGFGIYRHTHKKS